MTVGVRFFAAGVLALSAIANAAGPAVAPSPGANAHAPRSATPARAQPFSFVHGDLLAALQAVSAQNQCMLYAYDHNGNITARTDQTFGAATWGSSVFGCFKWTAP